MFLKVDNVGAVQRGDCSRRPDQPQKNYKMPKHHFCLSGATWRRDFLNWRWRNTDFTRLYFILLSSNLLLTHESATLISALLIMIIIIIIIIIMIYKSRENCKRKATGTHFVTIDTVLNVKLKHSFSGRALARRYTGVTWCACLLPSSRQW